MKHGYPDDLSLGILQTIHHPRNTSQDIAQAEGDQFFINEFGHRLDFRTPSTL